MAPPKKPKKPNPMEKGACDSCERSTWNDTTLRCPTDGMARKRKNDVNAWRSEVHFDPEGFPRSWSRPCPGWTEA